MQIEEQSLPVEDVQAHGVRPPAKAETYLSERQLTVLKSIVNGVQRKCTEAEVAKLIADIPAEADEAQRKAAERYARSCYTDYPGVMDYLVDQMFTSFSTTNTTQAKLILTLLGTRPGCFLLTGKFGPFDRLTDVEREAAVAKWRDSPVSDMRKLAKTFLSLPLWNLYMTQADACLATGYPFYGDPEKARNAQRVQPSYDFKFEDIAYDGQVFETGVLIIGTGCGGGVAAHTIANAGEEIMVIDKGQYIRTENVTGSAKEGMMAYYEAKGIMVAEEGGLSILAASTFGGGSAINWSASLRPPAHMREQWEKLYGLPHYNSPEFDEDVEYVCARMGVSSAHLKHSFANERLMAGAQRLGVHAVPIPQNTGGNQHSCGFCGHGCPYGEKQGSGVTWLKDAAEKGARFMQRTRVERILFGPHHDAPIDLKNAKAHYPNATDKVAIGALITGPDGKQGVIRARKGVVVSCGSINTPPTLIRSGLQNPNIGKGLHLHPCVFIETEWNEDVRPWEGSIMTALSDGAEDKDGQHFGSKLEVLAPSAAVASAAPIWEGTVAHKRVMMNYRHLAHYILLTRDRDSGSVTVDKDGNPLISYVPSAYDRQSATAGLVNGCRILLAAGAKRLATSQPFVGSYIPAPGHKGVDDPAFVAWLQKVADVGVWSMGTNMGSAHQMGSCHMGTRPSNSAIDSRGRVWGTEGLWVADASTFPTASGVNPMITTMSTARSIAKFAVEDMKAFTQISAKL